MTLKLLYCHIALCIKIPWLKVGRCTTLHFEPECAAILVFFFFFSSVVLCVSNSSAFSVNSVFQLLQHMFVHQYLVCELSCTRWIWFLFRRRTTAVRAIQDFDIPSAFHCAVFLLHFIVLYYSTSFTTLSSRNAWRPWRVTLIRMPDTGKLVENPHLRWPFY